MGRYIGTTDLRAYISPNGSLPATENGLLSSCINRAEAAIDSYCRRSFATAQGTVSYSQHTAKLVGQALYLTKDLYALHSLYNGNGTGTIATGSVWLEPASEGPPYRMLRLYSSNVWMFDTDGTIAVVGAWGYSGTAPDDIIQATVRYSAWLYRQKDLGGGAGVEVAGFPDGGEVQFPKGMPDDVRYLLAPYRSRTGGVV